MISRIIFHRFKQFRDQAFDLRPDAITLIAGGNNAGKSSILHGLAVWQFCKTAIEMERGPRSFIAGRSLQGLGLGDEEFSPINVPSLNHLWTNLRTRKETEPDGYTLKIACEWGHHRRLEFGLALANDRLFVKTTGTNLEDQDPIPRVAYLPPFAGITAREMRLPGAIRRRRIGEGLAGAVLRNLLLDMYERNLKERTRLRGNKTKIRDADLRTLRESDPWELLQSTLRNVFSTELLLAQFQEEYHSYIKVEIVKGEVLGHQLKRHADYNKRDLMVEGSGFLQWLSVYTLALDPNVDVLLLDEPDAHLHCSLQDQLLDNLRNLASKNNKQVLIATHSTEILRASRATQIFEVRSGGGNSRYLVNDQQKVALLAGLGSDYAPRIDRVRRTRRLLFVEGRSDLSLLRIFADRLGVAWPDSWVEWRSPAGHKERKQLFLALREEIPELVAVSLRDRDDESAGSVGPDLVDRTHARIPGFECRKWRRRQIESYLIWPPAIARASGIPETEIDAILAERFAVAVSRNNFHASDAPEVLLDLRGKLILKEGENAILGQINIDVHSVARAFQRDEVCDDIRTFINELVELAA